MGKIVVTGAKGGTGASIVDVLPERGYDVLSTDLLPSVEENYKQFDLRDAAGMSHVFEGADGVIHFGSPPGDTQFSTTEAFHKLQSPDSMCSRRPGTRASSELPGTRVLSRTVI